MQTIPSDAERWKAGLGAAVLCHIRHICDIHLVRLIRRISLISLIWGICGMAPVPATWGALATGGAQPAASAAEASEGAPAAVHDAGSAGGASLGREKPWRIQGNLSEACTCSVPCTCNFGGAPSPNHFCYAVFSLDIRKGHWGDVALDGLRLGAGNASKGTVWYLDERATEAQEAALRAIAHTIDAKLVAYWKGVDPKIVEDPQFTLLDFKKVKIEQEAGEKGNRLKIGDAGGFESDYLIGIDGKTPVVVENNWSWNILHGIKGKTRKLVYHDAYGNRIDTAATNANQGGFDWNDRTPIYLR
jgi:hypothetical protein